MKSVLISIHPKWCEMIASGKKTVEVRKTRPKIDAPFKCYIYCTKQFYRQGDGYFQGKHCGKVIGEFVCDNIKEYESEFVDDDCFEIIASIEIDEDGDKIGRYEWTNDADTPYTQTDFSKKSCVAYEDLKRYVGLGFVEFYGWHISDLVIYDKPKELGEFEIECKGGCDIPYMYHPPCENCRKNRLTRPPQSWCYVEKGGDE